MSTDDKPATTTYEFPTPNYVKVEMSEQLDQLFAALAQAQGEMSAAIKDSTNPFYHSKYADLASVCDAAKPLAKYELCYLQPVQRRVVNGELHVSVMTMLGHKSGQWIRSTLDMPVVREKKGEGYVPASDPQAVGSAITYARRYRLSAIVGIAQDDDDANAATGKNREGNGDRAAPLPANRPPQRPQAEPHHTPGLPPPKPAPPPATTPSAEFSWKDATPEKRHEYVMKRIAAAEKLDPTARAAMIAKIASNIKESDFGPELYRQINAKMTAAEGTQPAPVETQTVPAEVQAAPTDDMLDSLRMSLAACKTTAVLDNLAKFWDATKENVTDAAYQTGVEEINVKRGSLA